MDLKKSRNLAVNCRVNVIDATIAHKYFDGQEITHDEIIKGLKTSILNGSIVPVICGDSISNSGTAILLDSIVNYMPSPADVGSIKAQDDSSKEIEIEPDSNKPASIFIFKTTIDQFAGTPKHHNYNVLSSD